MPWILAALKPILIVWAGLKALDDVALLIRVGRLGVATLPLGSETDKCGMCDDIMGDLMAGADGISAIPCKGACLGQKKCIEMCERVQETSQTSTEFPCVVLGYCDAMETGYVNTRDVDCRGGAFFSCQPRQYCRRKRSKLKYTCELKPGIGRWNGMKHLASTHTAALADGLAHQRYCDEPEAGEFCIAQPRGFGVVAEWLGYALSLVYGGFRSVAAIESPGGNDDRQWLTFWLILSLWLFLERFFLRVILSNIFFYYELKLACLVWLLTLAGAETCYRTLRRFLVRYWRLGSPWSEEARAKVTLDYMVEIGGDVIQKELDRLSNAEGIQTTQSNEWPPDEFWQYEKEVETRRELNETELLLQLSLFFLSASGYQLLESAKTISESDKALLLERATEVVSFQPRYLIVELLGSIEGPTGEFPEMDRDGLADPYVVCQLVPASGPAYPDKGIKSKTVFNTLSPQWNETLEIPLQGGVVQSDGYFRSSETVKSTHLQLRFFDADVGLWSWALYICRALMVTASILSMLAYVEGTSDDATDEQHMLTMAFTIVLVLGYFVTYYMAVVRRSDDEPIGMCRVPLGILLDQQEHSLLLTLQPEDDGKKKNSVGGYGIVRTRLMLSEH